MSLSPKQQSNLKIAAIAAVQCEALYQLPAALTLAQWVEESGWGDHSPGNNCFGIKEYHGCFGTQTLQTTEFIKGIEQVLQQTFATFPTLKSCFEFRAELLTKGKRYASAFAKYTQSPDIEQLIRNIAPIYAPGNLDYPEKIINHIHDQRVIAALKEAVTIYGVHTIA